MIVEKKKNVFAEGQNGPLFGLRYSITIINTKKYNAL